jgi:hypothetical protein
MLNFGRRQSRRHDTGASDQDSIRADKGRDGNIAAAPGHTTVSDDRGDGLDLDELGDGSASPKLGHTDFLGSGFFDLSDLDLDDGVDLDETDGGNFEEGLDLNEAGVGDLTIDLDHVDSVGKNPLTADDIT